MPTRLMSATAAAVRSWAAQMLRYGMVGAVCAAMSNGVIIAGDLAGFAYPTLLAVALGLTTPLGYTLHSRFTYRSALSISRFARFVAGIFGATLLYVALMAIICSMLEIPPWLASPTVTALVLLWNIWASRWAIVRQSKRGCRRIALGERASLPNNQLGESMR